MGKYITEKLAAGIIRPSSSPVAAGFFFVEKKIKHSDRALITVGLIKSLSGTNILHLSLLLRLSCSRGRQSSVNSTSVMLSEN